MLRIKPLLLLLAFATQLSLASTVIYAVGTCKPGLPSFTTIQGALDATPAPNVVEVCPGTYNEQIVIGMAVTVEGISDGNSTQAVIAPPAGGLVVSATTDTGFPIAAQVFVQSSSEVNLSNLTVDGTGNNVTADNIGVVGVFYLGSPGTLNHLAVRNQSGNGYGYGVRLQGGIPVPSVIVENCSLRGFDNAGIITETNSSLFELDATIKDNYVSGGFQHGVVLEEGQTTSITGNLVVAFWGIQIGGGGGSVSKNTTITTEPFNYTGGAGIALYTDGVPVTSNAVYNYSSSEGLVVNSSDARVTGNTITDSGIAIDFTGTAGNNVHSNRILGAGWGTINVATGATPINTFYNVGTIACTPWPDC
jgi:parallel beta-helix repeat protein